MDVAKYAYRKPSAGGVFENSLAFQSAIFQTTPTVVLIDWYTVPHDLSFVNILLSLFAIIPDSLGERACFVGRQVPKMRRQDPLCAVAVNPCPADAHHAAPAPPVRPTKRAVDGGDSSPFSRVLWHRVFSVAQVGSHPPPLTLTVGPPRHIRAHI